MSLDRYTDRFLNTNQAEPAFSYLLGTFLQSRIATDHESNKEYFDEDVNIYLSLLLNSMISVRFHELASTYVTGYESDMSEIVDSADSFYTKYQIYRFNADFLLLSTGLFFASETESPEERDVLASVERGKTYYRIACSYTERIPERYRPMSATLAKLAHGFEVYRDVLNFMRGEYLGIVPQISEREMGLIQEGIEDVEATEKLRLAHDALLDAYLEHTRNPDERSRAKVDEEIKKLREIDPDASPEFDLGD